METEKRETITNTKLILPVIKDEYHKSQSELKKDRDSRLLKIMTYAALFCFCIVCFTAIGFNVSLPLSIDKQKNKTLDRLGRQMDNAEVSFRGISVGPNTTCMTTSTYIMCQLINILNKRAIDHYLFGESFILYCTELDDFNEISFFLFKNVNNFILGYCKERGYDNKVQFLDNIKLKDFLKMLPKIKDGKSMNDIIKKGNIKETNNFVDFTKELVTILEVNEDSKFFINSIYLKYSSHIVVVLGYCETMNSLLVMDPYGNYPSYSNHNTLINWISLKEVKFKISNESFYGVGVSLKVNK